MSKRLRWKFIIISLLLFTASAVSQAQDASTGPGTENYREQIRRLMGFLEFSLNTLGDPETSAREKETIILESYAKAFLNEKVQVEDDLDENREILTYKDVQAYLKDVDFFFTQVEFNFDIQDIQSLTSADGMNYFKVTANRNLKGTTVNDEPVNNNKIRYIEINLDEEEQVLKIASIYTTRLNETEELISWWNAMPRYWKEVLGKDFLLSDSLQLSQADLLNDSTALRISYEDTLISRDSFIYIGLDSLLVTQLDTVALKKYDTIGIARGIAISALRGITGIEALDVHGNPDIFDLYPLSQTSELKSLNVAGTPVTDLFPARSLTKLNWLNISGTMIDDLEPIRYNTLIRELYADSTLVESLEPVEGFSALEVLHVAGSRISDIRSVRFLSSLSDFNLAGTAVSDIQAVADLANLQRINISGTSIATLEALQYMIRLKRIYLEGTAISDLTPLSKLDSLQYIYADRSGISDLSPLEPISGLQKVYCDQTQVTRTEANRFMAARPGTLIIYESQGLTAWWAGLSPEWKEVFRALVSLDEVPTREQLHQVTLLASLDISSNTGINNMEPVSMLSNLKEINASGTSIGDLTPLAELTALQNLNVSETAVTVLDPLQALSRLENLDVSGTALQTLDGLGGLKNLKSLNLDNTSVTSLEAIAGNPDIALVYCDQTGINKEEALRYMQSHPSSLVVFQTGRLQGWWDGLPEPWRIEFQEHIRLDQPPTREQLQSAVNLLKLDFSGNREISSLLPLGEMMAPEEIILANCNVSDIGTLGSLASLKAIDLSGNPLTDLSPLAGLSLLAQLNISNTPIVKLDALEPVASLEQLNCSGTQVKKLDPLAGLINLKKIECQNTGVSNLKPLLGLPNLRMLVCYNTKLSEKKIAAFRAEHPAVEVVFY